MSEFGLEVLGAARSRIGRPFSHHFKSAAGEQEDLCGGGVETVDACMERGMTDEGYDCSGLAIVSICDVLGLQPQAWPRELRHVMQFQNLARPAMPVPGDLLVFKPHIGIYPMHMGVFATPEASVHASGITKVVEESEVKMKGGSWDVGVVHPAELADLIR